MSQTTRPRSSRSMRGIPVTLTPPVWCFVQSPKTNSQEISLPNDGFPIHDGSLIPTTTPLALTLHHIHRHTRQRFDRRPLTIRFLGKYDRRDPSPSVPIMTNQCVLPATRSIRTQTWCARVLWSIAPLFMLSVAPTSLAAGCHAQDRPVLHFEFSWESDQKNEVPSLELTQTPPVLTHLPCEGEIPLGSTSLTLPSTALWCDNSGLVPSDCNGLLLTRARIVHSQPPSLRLDRPPRPAPRLPLGVVRLKRRSLDLGARTDRHFTTDRAAGCANGAHAGLRRKTPLDRAGIVLSTEQSWHAQNSAKWMVPGTALAAWSGPDGSSFVVYRTLWVPGGSAEMLAEALGNRLENLPGLKLLVKRTETLAGVAAARVEVVAPGTGDSLAATGLGELPSSTGNDPDSNSSGNPGVQPPLRCDLPHLAHAGRLLRSDRAGDP